MTNIKNNKLLLNMIAQIIALLVNFGVSFFLTPLIVNKIGESSYGFVGLANDFVSYAQIITVALNSMAGRFITISIHRDDFDSANKYFSSVFMSNIIISVILTLCSILLILLLPNIFDIPFILIGDVRLLFTFITFNFIIGIITSIFSISTFANNKLYLQSKRKIESYIIKSVILILTYFFLKPYLWYIGTATIVSTIYSSIVDIYYTKKFFPQLKISKNNFEVTKVFELIKSGIWNSLSKLSSILSNGLDLIISNKFVGAVGMGVLSISKTLPTMILSVFSLLASVFAPDLTISYAKNDHAEMKRQLLNSIKILSFFACIPVTILFVFGIPFYKLWVPSTNYNLIYLLSILTSAGMIFCLPFEGLWNIFTVTNKVKNSSLFLLMNSICTIAIVFIVLPFTNDLNLKLCIIAGVSSLFSIIRNLTFLPIYGAKCIGESKTLFYPILLKYIVSLIMICGCSFFIKILINPITWLNLIVCIFFTCVISIPINFMLLLNKNERLLVINTIKNKLYKRRCASEK